jgi:hypothetical protein
LNVKNQSTRWPLGRLGRQGVALPVAIFALLIITVLITGVLLTASTEQVLSFAQQDATRDLYAAEGAVNAYVGRQNTLPSPVVNEVYSANGTLPPVRITITQEASFPASVGGTERSTWYSIRAEPQNGGRTFVSTVKVFQTTLPPVNFDGVDSPFTLAGDAGNINNNTTREVKIDNGTNSTSCDPTNPANIADHAIVQASSANPPNNPDNILMTGDYYQDPRSPEQLITDILGGISMRDFAWSADVKFGPYFNEPAFQASKKVTSTYPLDGPDAKYNWGCPGRLDALTNCWQTRDTTNLRVVAIDGQGQNVTLTQDHGHGMLIVLNGTLVISSKFIFKGLILAERNVKIQGGGNNNSPTIDGAIISAAQGVVDGEQSLDLDPSHTTGHASVYFNRCVLNLLQDKFNSGGQPGWGEPTVRGRPSNWFEVLR